MSRSSHDSSSRVANVLDEKKEIPSDMRTTGFPLVIERDSSFSDKCNVIACGCDSTDAMRNFHLRRCYNEGFCFSVTGLREGVQQRIGAHEAQTDAQRREEIRVHDVRQGIQTAGPPVSTD